MGVPIVTTDASGAVATPPAYTMAGFPGQTHTLSDLYYNRYRDYDSSIGRYIQADPIGLGGGSNPYVYAGANPLRWTDSKGLSAELAVPLLEGLGGGAAEGASAGGIGAACLSNPVGWVVCGGAAVGAAAYGGYKLYEWWNKPCNDGSVLQMAKGGKQNKENEWSRAARLQPDPCEWLEKMYNDPNTSKADRDKIYTAQKVLRCRWSSMKR